MSEAISLRIINAIRDAIHRDFSTLHEPSFQGSEQHYVQDCLKSTFVSSVGQYVTRFEQSLASYTGSKHAVACASGTAALHVCLLLGGVQANDEVLIPAISFVATANAVRYCNATPHFVDSETETLGMDPTALGEWLSQIAVMKDGKCKNKLTNATIRAIVPMHTFGHPCRMNEIIQLASEWNLSLIEDAAESLGSLYANQHTGTFGRLAAVSFNGNKIVTTGGGGAILTNDTELAARAKHLTTTAKLPHRWDYVHDEVGYNYRMPNLNAALGVGQLEQLEAFVASKRKLFEKYRRTFADIKNIRVLEEPTNCRSNYWLQTILLDDDLLNSRDEILQMTNDAGLMTRPIWKLLPQLPPYQKCPSAPLPVAKKLQERCINLPSSAGLA
jgi:perosamine synthetase